MNNLVQYQQRAEQQHAKAAYQSRYYTAEQLRQFQQTASVGFVCAGFASWVLLAFFIGQFMAGAEFEEIATWRAVQYVYAVMGIALATAIVFAEVVLFNSGRAREYWAVVVFAVGFSIFAESAATMQREQTSVAYKSTQSEVYKATLKAVDTLATTTTLSPAQVQLSRLQAQYDAAKQQGNRASMEMLQVRISRMEHQATLEMTNRANALQGTLTQAKQLEYDETKHQAMIRFLAEAFGLSHVVSSALLAFFLVLTFKICFHYLGAMRQLNDRALSIGNGSISAVITPMPLGVSPALPPVHLGASPALPSKPPAPPMAKSTSLGSAEEQIAMPLQLPVGESVNSGKSSVYAIAEAAKVGTAIDCPQCGAVFQKSNKWHLFCSNNRKPRMDGGNCSDDWHNTQNPDRAEHAKRKGKGGVTA